MRPFSWKEIWIPQLSPWEIIFRATLVYFFVQLVFRVLGRKEWTRYSVFNMAILFFVAVALRTTMVGNDSSVTAGIVAFTTIAFLDWSLSHLQYKSKRAADWLSGPVRQLVRDGVPVEAQLKKARISRDELLAQARMNGYGSLSEVGDAYLERSGRFSFIRKQPDAARKAA